MEPACSEPVRGYLSEESKRRFTVVAGVLGAVFFLVQLTLPVVLVFGLLLSGMMFQEFRQANLERATVWQGDLWFVEKGEMLSFTEPDKRTALCLKHLSLADLTEASHRVALKPTDTTSIPALLADSGRLWLLGEQDAAVYEQGMVRTLDGGVLPRHSSAPFLHRGLPTVVVHGRAATLEQLHVEGYRAEWRPEPVALDPPMVGDERVTEVQAVPVGDRLFLVIEVGEPESDRRSLLIRELAEASWGALGTDLRGCGSWRAVAYDGGPAVLLSENEADGGQSLSILRPGEGGIPTRTSLDELRTRRIPRRWSAFPQGNALILVSEGMPGSRRLAEVVEGRVVRRVDVAGGFPFGRGMMAMMFVPQLMPFVLSLALAFILTAQMRKHRVTEYEAEGQRRVFASLWQRALAQAVDVVFLGAGAVLPGLWMWRSFSNFDRLLEDEGPYFPLVAIGLMVLSLAWVVGVLVVFSFTEGRSGKTPGKWLLGIRVLGTDLRPCGFGRALLRNLLTFADGFFNFLVGILLEGLTEQWQRLGDLAARTVVVVDKRTVAVP